MIEALLERFRQRDRLALSRLLSLLARGQHATEIMAGVGKPAKPARVVAVTGSAGVGKSTLVGKLIETFRARGASVAVLACDPQSRLSGGALLADRFRMPSRPEDAGVFIRSLAAASGSLAEHLPAMVRLLEAFGFDLILIETVGAGQYDTAVHGLADMIVLLLQPETGDDLQWEKAGVMEVADIVVIHKADMPGTDRTEMQVRASLELGSGPQVPVLRVSSRTGQGLDDLAQAILAFPLRRSVAPTSSELLRLTQETLATRFTDAVTKPDEALKKLLGAWQEGQLDDERAAVAALKLLSPQ